MTDTPAPETVWAKLGVPRLTGNTKFVGATLIDSVGTGLVLAFTVVYFAKTTSVPLAVIGLAITTARLLALPAAVVAGLLIDRFTARRTATWANLLSVVGYLGFLLADSVWKIVLVTFLVQVGHTTYWTSSGGLVVLAAPKDLRTRWFGFLTALRNTAMGLGGALSAFAFALGDTDGLRLIVIGNAASYVLAATLLHLWHPVRADEPPAADTPPVEAAEPARGGYATVLRDHAYTVLIGVNTTLVFAQMLIKVLLAIYIVEALELDAWIAGVLIVVNTLQVSLTQTLVARQAERFRPTRVIMVASLLNALAFGLFALIYTTPDWLTFVGLFVAMVVFTAGETVGFPPIDTLSVSMPPDHIRGRYLATYQMSWALGEVAAPALLTFLLGLGPVLPMLFLLVLSLLALPLLANLERRTGLRAART
ncbi:MFS transporter [Actinosynnema sp. NPDC020468]|uniref:MFS transporter n=1 Tax=Actinosynnema sp. NPDC020468 TaxID=3154488 RepID=UPI0033CADD83